MFAFLNRRKAASFEDGVEAAEQGVSATARRKRLLARIVMAPDLVVPVPRLPDALKTFGQRPPPA